MVNRPNENEYPQYYVPYVQLVPEGDLLEILKENLKQVTALFGRISDDDANSRYAPDKWSIKEVLSHITDTERIMSYRLLRIGRGDQTPLAGFDETEFVSGSQAAQLSLEQILNDFTAVRNATITLVQNMPESAWANIGIANDMEVTARAVAYIIAGHETHHRKIVTERYLSQLQG
ncbi:DinB family protein [Neobacillus dielmonensis]|uniref:DinB family protein n=1 Tax=Neobacillus dielmonensis TaxID=1347369 RepID=UPI0005A756B8|nr:DinB family protein [Neobacillus dielmonensis]